jgi:hypothetical protein
MLNILELFDMKNRTGLNVHRTVEIMKFGAAARCDPQYARCSLIILVLGQGLEIPIFTRI